MALLKYDGVKKELVLLDAGSTMKLRKPGDWVRVFYYSELQCLCVVSNVSYEDLVYSELYKGEIIKACQRYATYLKSLYDITKSAETKEIATERLYLCNQMKNELLHGVL